MPDAMLTSGAVYNFDSASYTCSFQPDGALSTFLKGVPVSRQIMPSLLANGVRASLLLFDDNNPTDGMVVGVTTANLAVASCRVYRGSSQSIPNGSQTVLSFTNARHDSMGAINPMWSLADPTDVVLRTPGIYIATACVEFDANGAGERTVAIFDTASNQFIAIEERAPVGGDSTDITCSSGPFYAAGPTSFQVHVVQTSGAALNVNASAAYTPELSVAMIG